MVARTWFGGTGQWNKASNWDPIGVPVSGQDIAILTSGTAKLHNQVLTGLSIQLNGQIKTTEPVLVLHNVAMNSNVQMSGIKPGGGTFFGEIDAKGVVTSTGTIVLGSGRGPGAPADLTIHLEKHSAFVNTGQISMSLANFKVETPDAGKADDDVFVNNGVIRVQGGEPFFDVPVIGTGSFVGPPSGLSTGWHFGQSVGSDLTVTLAGLQQPQSITLDEPIKFLAEIDGFGIGLPNTINLPNTPTVTSDTFAANHLKLFDHGKLVADLNIVGDFTAANFKIQPNPVGGTQVQFVPTGAAPAMATASTPQIELLPQA